MKPSWSLPCIYPVCLNPGDRSMIFNHEMKCLALSLFTHSGSGEKRILFPQIKNILASNKIDFINLNSLCALLGAAPSSLVVL